MDSIAKDYSPKLTQWFSPNIEYVGLGIATFSQPTGTIQGHTHVRYDESGTYEIQMTVEKITFEDIEIDDVRFRLPYLFAGIEAGVRERVLGFVSQAIRNPCVELTVTTSEGRFVATELGTNYRPTSFILEDQATVVFHPLQAHFEADSSSPAHYFVAPLTNILNSSGWFTRYHPVIAQHPLRIVRSPAIPDDLPSEDKKMAYLLQQAGQAVERFEFLDEPAFIEPLADYKDREKQLKDGNSKCQITAIMVGTVADKEITALNWESLGFRDLLPLLSLAVGIYVGSPWLELRDKDGKLVRRIHTNLAKGTYKKGMGALGAGVDRGGLGYLLSVAQKSPEFNKLYLRAAISQIVMGGYFDFDGNIEDRMSHLYRALDCLCGEHIPRKRSVILRPESLKELKKITENLTKDIDNLADSMLTPSADDGAKREAEELTGIANAIRDVVSQLGFSKRIELLLEKFNLEDAQILDDFYKTHAGPNNVKRWSAAVVYYRNKIMHSAWFDWEGKDVNIEEIKAITFHLHDVLVRIILILLGYDGKYEPSIFRLRGLSKEVRWVQKSGTSAKDLGYE